MKEQTNKWMDWMKAVKIICIVKCRLFMLTELSSWVQAKFSVVRIHLQCQGQGRQSFMFRVGRVGVRDANAEVVPQRCSETPHSGSVWG